MEKKTLLIVIVLGLFAGFTGSFLALKLFLSKETNYKNPPSISLSTEQPKTNSTLTTSTTTTTTVLSANLKNCVSEYEKYCKVTHPDEGGPTGCLIDVIELASPKCQETLRPFVLHWNICAAEIKKYCPNVKAGKMRIPKCLKLHTEGLSTACAIAVLK